MNKSEVLLRKLISEVLLMDDDSRVPKVNETKVYIVERRGVKDISFGMLMNRRRQFLQLPCRLDTV